MPNRMLRDWTGSDKVNSLSVHAERFFTRLIMKVDDYGCFYADTRLLKANLFPLLLDDIREADISRWKAECQKAGLIALYAESGKEYVIIKDFRQRLDRAKSKFPLPKTTDTPEVVNDYPPEREIEVEYEVEGKGSIPHTDFGERNKHLFKNKKEKDSSPGAEILYTIEHCITVAMADDRWVKDNKASSEILALFNAYLSGQGIYEKNPADYKKHFYHWNKKEKNGTHQQSVKQPVNRKSAGAEQLLTSLKADIANYSGSGSRNDQA